jgi:uncharacterized protein (DUF1778 family)
VIRRWRRRRLLRKIRERRQAAIEIKIATEDFERVLRDLENPGAPSAALVELMARRPPWEK